MIKIKQKLFDSSASTDVWQRCVNWAFDTPTRQIAIACIGGYQRYLSPHKGFACAYRRLHGGDSCSQYVKNLLTQQGVIATLNASRQRFQACRDADQRIFNQ
ncbi:MAG: membrane protein insertion efficiency factor YidD [Coleofasciculus sp. C2-GNP5-27]